MTTNDETKTKLNEAIVNALSELDGFTTDQPEYAKAVEQIERLYKIKISVTPVKENKNPLSKDAVLAVIGNLTGIGMILGFEQVHVVTSKALNFVLKNRV